MNVFNRINEKPLIPIANPTNNLYDDFSLVPLASILHNQLMVHESVILNECVIIEK